MRGRVYRHFSRAVDFVSTLHRTRLTVESLMADELVIAGRAFKSRLIVGTGKYRSFQEMARAHAASGADMVTVAVRRVNLTDKSKESLLDYIDREKIFILPNTAACYTADEAIRTARLGREVGLSNWVKLEVIGDQQTLFPDTEQLIEATRVLVKEGFVVLPYTNDDLIAARKLIDAGASAVMPLAAPIGSGLGVQNPANLRILRERITEVPMVVDADVCTRSRRWACSLFVACSPFPFFTSGQGPDPVPSIIANDAAPCLSWKKKNSVPPIDLSETAPKSLPATLAVKILAPDDRLLAE